MILVASRSVYNFASDAKVLCGLFSVSAMVNGRVIISLADDVWKMQPDIKGMASHKNMASLVLEKAMVMEDYMMNLP